MFIIYFEYRTNMLVNFKYVWRQRGKLRGINKFWLEQVVIQLPEMGKREKMGWRENQKMSALNC